MSERTWPGTRQDREDVSENRAEAAGRGSEAEDGVRTVRLTLQDQNRAGLNQELPRGKPIGRAFALVQSANGREPLNFEPIKPTEEKVEVIKVYLEARRQDQTLHDESLKMLSDEVSHIQEVRYCLKSLRQQMAARQGGRSGEHRSPAQSHAPQADLPRHQSPVCSPTLSGSAPPTQEWEDPGLSESESARMRELTRRLYGQYQARLQEAERRHQEERTRLEVRSGHYQQQLSHQQEALRQAQDGLSQRDSQIEDLNRLLSGMGQEQRSLLDKMKESEAELAQLRTLREESRSKEERSAELEKELAVLKEKIHHLDDMLKSQQRKVRHMIEQLQNSRTVIQERDRVIRELQEKVAFLEAENREMHDRMDFLLSSQNPEARAPEPSSRIVYSKPLVPSSAGKPLPHIRVVEIRS
ncbi:tuftelin 1a isoform X1 [Lepisosteus oculatus]|uniref:tuftelin 1a isoform X1 n=1 Tax=Lepisosteus oculatus TaxID=7918 RepID=UPI00371D495A